MTEKEQQEFFTRNLLIWFSENHRPMPWKGEKNPYYIWLSEIILQQTRVEQGLPYFLKFKEHYPTVQDLANAAEDEVMKMWEGLGYYSRARNLHFTAKHISNELDGIFPSTHEEILKLKGVGSYTAAAIASFAYDLPHAVVDGNVYRVLSRYFGIDTPIDSTTGKKLFSALANELLPNDKAADFNQAIMDFGATHCTPKKPKCKSCLLNSNCIGFNMQKNDILPVKSKKIKKRERFFNYLLINYDKNVFLQKRIKKDIWQDLYQFPMIETVKMVDALTLEKEETWKLLLKQIEGKAIISKTYKQLLTHQKIWAVFYEVKLNAPIDAEIIEKMQLIMIERDKISNFAFPKIIDLFLKEKTLSLKLF